nr:uncharacterized protein LOC109417296 [Aedes albopictus]
MISSSIRTLTPTTISKRMIVPERMGESGCQQCRGRSAAVGACERCCCTKTYANLVKSGFIRSPAAAAILKPVARIQQRTSRTSIRNVPFSVVLVQRSSSWSSSYNGGPMNIVSSTGGGLGGNKYDCGQQQKSSQQQQHGSGTDATADAKPTAPIRDNGDPTSDSRQSSPKQQDSRSSYQKLQQRRRRQLTILPKMQNQHQN